MPSVGFNLDCVTENCSDSKVPYNCPSNYYQNFCNLGYNSENSVFSQP